MSELGQRIRRFFRVVADTISPVRAPVPQVRKIERTLGPMTRQYMIALGDVLSASDFEQLTVIGHLERNLLNVYERLRPITSLAGRAGELAATTRQSIDSLLSEPNGYFSLTLTEFPVRDSSRCELAVARLRARYEATHIAASKFLDARHIATKAESRLQSIRLKFDVTMSITSQALGLAELEEQLRHATSLASAEYVSATVDACATLLEEHHAALMETSCRLEAVLDGLHQRPLDRELGTDLVSRVASLRAAVQHAAADAVARDTAVCDRAADVHFARMHSGEAADIFEVPSEPLAPKKSKRKRSKVSPPRVLVSRWSALHGFRLKPIGQQTILPLSFAMRSSVIWPKSGDI